MLWPNYANYLPPPGNNTCAAIVELVGPYILGMLDQYVTPDLICNAVGMCEKETDTCRLFPPPKGINTKEEYEREVSRIVAQTRIPQHIRGAFNICTILPGACSVINHEPFFDADGDLYSTADVLRGNFWRGRDCNDNDSSVFPGRTGSSDVTIDSNCNGIFGVDPATNASYEDEWCKGTGSLGVAVLGDSASAHFRIPPNYLVAANLSAETFAGVFRNLANELDWPMLSAVTGHYNASVFAPDIEGPMDSVYWRMKNWNLCNTNDYQNIGVNGADSGSLLSDLSKRLMRDSRLNSNPQKPLLLYMAMIGNDVCGSSLSYTTPQQYHDNIVQTFENLDPYLPSGTKVVLVGLVDGRVLYNSMWDRIHPIGSTNQDVTYQSVYDFLNCLDISPCRGWMNSNETIRNMTSAQARLLRDQLPIIVNETKTRFKNLELFYLGDLLDHAINAYPGPKWTMIEPVDGFHPNQYGMALFAEFLWNATVKAGLVGPPNPNNAKIQEKFFP